MTHNRYFNASSGTIDFTVTLEGIHDILFSVGDDNVIFGLIYEELCCRKFNELCLTKYPESGQYSHVKEIMNSDKLSYMNFANNMKNSIVNFLNNSKESL
jgi:hypothetical protein